MKTLLTRADLRISLMYAVFAGLWILGSDRLLAALVPDIALVARLQTFKGWAFVGVTTVLLYLLLHREFARRRQAEQALQENSEFMSSLLENSPFPIYITGADQRLKLVNRQWEQAVGIPRTRAVDRLLVELFSADVAEKLGRDNLQVIESGTRLELEEEVHGRNYLTIKFPLRDASGQISSAGGMSIDMTDRKRAEAQLTSQARLIDKFNDAVLVADENYALTSWNRAAEQIYGWKAEEVIGKYSEAVLGTEFIGMDRAAVRKQLRETGEWSGETIQTRRDGTRIFVDASAVVIRAEDGRTMGYLSVNRNITERKQIEAALAESRQRLQALFDYSQDAILLADDQAHYIDVNPAACQLFGYTREELLRLTVWDLPPLPNQELGSQLWQQFIAEGRQSGEFIIRRRNGETVVVEYRSVANILPGVHLSITRDISERRRTEEALRQTETLLSTVINSAPLTIFATDVQGNFTISEGLGLERIGVKPDQHVDRSAFQMYGSLPIQLEGGEIISGEQIIRRALAGETVTAFVEMDEICYENRVGPLRDGIGNISGIVGVALDVTKRRQAENALRRSEELYRRLTESYPNGTVNIYDRDLRMTFVAGGELQTSKFSPKDFIGKTFQELSPPETYAVAEPVLRAAFEGQTGSYEAPYWGGRVYLVNVAPLREPDGSVKEIMVVTQNVTERKRAEEALRASEELWRTIFAAANDAILLLDEQYEITAHNHAAEAIYGAPPTGRSLLDLRPAHLQEDGRLRMQQALREAGGRWETLHVRADSSTFPVEISTKPFESGGKRQFVHIVRDVTQHRQLEENLRQAELKYRTLVEQIPPIIYMAGPDQHIGVTYISPRIGMLGFTQEEWIADPQLWLRQIHPDDRNHVLAWIADIQASGRATPHEYRLLARDGTIRWFLDETMDVVDENGRFLFRQGIMLDISERKQAEQALRQSRDRLAQLSRQLSRVRENEQRAIGRELHDQVGQMLTAIRITLKILPELPPERAAQKIQRALEITDELLERVSRLSLRLRPPMLDDLGLIPALVWHINQFQEETAIQVEFRHSGLEGRRFDPEQETNAYRIVQEALTNTARHSGAAHARIEIRADRESANGEELLEIRIEDDGRGFDPEAALAKNRGLSGMRERARLLGGVFQIDSQPGAGTRTLIRLPLQMEAL